ncbi:Hypothetical predicted protein [Podarcis lilfordi]|uniref:Uncharacterized protein n=1 Tax=Podarcis lilfordi TaxID=74358 RepID=A0AA35LC39_9SAUR|nr:Hypothetical predicted protein [Podarcis lilfordi]
MRRPSRQETSLPIWLLEGVMVFPSTTGDEVGECQRAFLEVGPRLPNASLRWTSSKNWGGERSLNPVISRHFFKQTHRRKRTYTKQEEKAQHHSHESFCSQTAALWGSDLVR